MTFHLPWDLSYWFITVFAGSAVLFMAFMIIAIAALAAYFRMPNTITMVMIALFTIIMGAWTGEFLFIVVIIIGLLMYWMMSRVVK